WASVCRCRSSRRCRLYRHERKMLAASMKVLTRLTSMPVPRNPLPLAAASAVGGGRAPVLQALAAEALLPWAASLERLEPTTLMGSKALQLFDLIVPRVAVSARTKIGIITTANMANGPGNRSRFADISLLVRYFACKRKTAAGG